MSGQFDHQHTEGRHRHGCLRSAATTDPVQSVDPIEVGLDPDRLRRLDRHFQRYIDDGRLMSWQLVLARGGQIAHSVNAGHRDSEAGTPVTADTIWRIYSMTKPITSVAALLLWEEGAFELKDPVSKFLPEFADTKVWRAGSVNSPILDPMTETMEMWHLMTHTSGLTYGFMYSHAVDDPYRRAGFEWGVPQSADLAGICEKLAALPPVPTGQRVELLDVDRRARQGPRGDHRTDARRAAAGAALHAPAAHLGGGGLVSTMADYLRFAEMLLRGGELDGVRLLSPRTVEYATHNHLPGGADLTAFGRPLFSETGGRPDMRVDDPAAPVEHPPDPQSAQAARPPGTARLNPNS